MTVYDPIMENLTDNEWPDWVSNYPGLKTDLDYIVAHVIVLCGGHPKEYRLQLPKKNDWPEDYVPPVDWHVDIPTDPDKKRKRLAKVPTTHSEISNLAKKQAEHAEALRIGTLKLFEIIPALKPEKLSAKFDEGKMFSLMAKVRDTMSEYAELMDEIRTGHFNKNSKSMWLSPEKIAAEELLFVLGKANATPDRWDDCIKLFELIFEHAGMISPEDHHLSTARKNKNQQKS